MSAKDSGFLIHFDEGRRRDFIQAQFQGTFEPFSDTLSVLDWEFGQVSVALLCFKPATIDYIALVRKGKQVATLKYRVEFSSIVSLRAVPIATIEAKLDSPIKHHFIKASQGDGGAIPRTTWAALIEIIKSERPDLTGEIERVLSLRRYSGFSLRGEGAEVLMQEREALGISLDIFSGNNQLRNRVLGEWAPAADSVTGIDEANSTGRLGSLAAGRSSFLSGISESYLQEESAIQHDLFNWPGMSPLHELGISTFSQGARRLEVIYANRNGLEQTLGVDLIYYNEIFQLFVLVQYKLMREESGHMLYRPDSQLRVELARMDHFYTSHKVNSGIQAHNEYRLNDDGFMLKLVPNKGLIPSSGELIKGMYLPREYVHFLLSPQGPKGSGGGIQFTFDNAPRYLDNSTFSASVHDGWIGTRGVQSQSIKNMIKHYYETGRSLLLSYETRC
jgi:hypothetical protein